jgi:hypothetical protein
MGLSIARSTRQWLRRKTRHRNRRRFQLIEAHFFAALTFAHLALAAALIRARPAAEMRRLGAMETTFWPRVRAQRAFCDAEILARAAALILRGPCDLPVLFIPLSALIALSSAFTFCAALSRSAFNSSSMSMCSPSSVRNVSTGKLPVCRARARQDDSQRRHANARASWDASGQPAWLTSELYSQKSNRYSQAFQHLPFEHGLEFSRWYAGKIRRGHRPHPRHWQTLAELAGVSADL